MEDQRGYWGVIPGEVFHDQELTAAAKLLYLVLSSMAHKDGYCWPSNETLAAEMDLSKRRVRELLSKLQERGYIRIEVQRNEGTQEVERRNIYCGLFVGREAPPPSCENPQDPPAGSCRLSGEIPPDPPAESRQYLIGRKDKAENIPPIPPKGADTGGSRKRAARKRDKFVPTWKPERFEGFWAYYRTHARGEDRQGAAKAWDKLQPDDVLIDAMARALQAQTATEDWQRGIGIPYAKTWLNNARWKDTPKPPPAPNPSEEGEQFGWQ